MAESGLVCIYIRDKIIKSGDLMKNLIKNIFKLIFTLLKVIVLAIVLPIKYLILMPIFYILSGLIFLISFGTIRMHYKCNCKNCKKNITFDDLKKDLAGDVDKVGDVVCKKIAKSMQDEGEMICKKISKTVEDVNEVLSKKVATTLADTAKSALAKSNSMKEKASEAAKQQYHRCAQDLVKLSQLVEEYGKKGSDKAKNALSSMLDQLKSNAQSFGSYTGDFVKNQNASKKMHSYLESAQSFLSNNTPSPKKVLQELEKFAGSVKKAFSKKKRFWNF